jgi:hypothetical protein
MASVLIVEHLTMTVWLLKSEIASCWAKVYESKIQQICCVYPIMWAADWLLNFDVKIFIVNQCIIEGP